MLNSIEIWKDVPDFEGYYEVSSLGRVRNCRTKKIKAQSIQTNGKYYQCSLWKNNKEKRVLTHRCVAKAFISNPLDKEHVNHKDKNVFNNTLSNLEWVTCSENHLHSYKTGRVNAKAFLGKKRSTASKYRYVYWDAKRSNWKASVKKDNKTHNIGRFNNDLDAAIAADSYIKSFGWTDKILNFK